MKIKKPTPAQPAPQQAAPQAAPQPAPQPAQGTQAQPQAAPQAQPQPQPVQQPYQQPQPAYSNGDNGARFGGSLLDSMSARIDTGQSSQEIYEKLTTPLDSVSNSLRASGLELRHMLLPNNVKSNTSILAFDTILLAMRAGQTIVTYTFVINDKRNHGEIEVKYPDIDSAMMYTHRENKVSIPRVVSEGYNQTFKDVMEQNLGKLFKDVSGEVDVEHLPSKIWYDVTTVRDPQLLVDANAAMSNMLNTIRPTWKDPKTVKRLKSLYPGVGNSNGIAIKVGGGIVSDDQQLYHDELGTPVSPTVSVQVSANRRTGTDNIHTHSPDTLIGTAMVRTDVIYTGNPLLPPGAPQQFITPGRQSMNSFTPIVYVEELMDPGISLEDALLTLGVTYHTLSPDMVRRSYNPMSLCPLNIACNVLGKDVPEPISAKNMNSEYDKLYNSFMKYNSLSYSLVLKPGTHNLTTLRYFGSTGSAAANKAESEAALRQALDNMTDGQFSSEHPSAILSYQSEPEPYLAGTYSLNTGEVRPLSEIGLLQIMTLGNETRQAIRYWVESQSPMLSRDQSVAYKLAALKAIGIMYNLQDVYTAVPLNERALAVIANIIRSNNLITSSNVQEFNSQSGDRGWSIHRNAPTVGTFYGVNNQPYGQPMYGQPQGYPQQGYPQQGYPQPGQPYAAPYNTGGYPYKS